MWINCARDCGGKDKAYCSSGHYVGWSVEKGNTIRLPHAKDAGPCEDGRGYLAAVLFPPILTQGLRLRVTTTGAWRVADAAAASSADPHAICNEPLGVGDSCRIIVESSTLSDYDFWFITDDPNASPANCTVEVVPYGTVCD